MKIEDKLRAQYVKRWHIVETSKQQTLAEHSYNVTLLVLELCDRCNIKIDLELVLAAIYHDLYEVITGDVPGPTKNKIPKEALGILGVKASEYPYKTASIDSAKAEALVKVADYLEAYIFISIHGVGLHARKVADDAQKELMAVLEKAGEYFPERTYELTSNALRIVANTTMDPDYTI